MYTKDTNFLNFFTYYINNPCYILLKVDRFLIKMDKNRQIVLIFLINLIMRETKKFNIYENLGNSAVLDMIN